MFGRLSIIIIATLSFLCVVEYLVIDHLERESIKAYKQISDLSQKLDTQNNAIDDLRIAAIAKAKLLDKAQEDAVKLKNEYDRDAKKVLAQSVPVNCEKAVAWAAEQAPAIYEIWFDEP